VTTAAASFPPLVPEGEQLANNPAELEELFKDLRQNRSQNRRINSIAFSPDGKTLATGDGDGSVSLWEVTTGQEVKRLKGHTDVVTSVAYSPDGKMLALGSEDKTVRVWEVATGQEVKQLTGHTGMVTAVAYSPDGKTLASGSWDGTVRVGGVATGQEVKQLTGHTSMVTAVAYSPDGKTLASGSWDGTVRVWEVATGQEVKRLAGHTKWVTAVAYSPDGKTLASGSWDNTVRVWEVATGQEVRRLTGHTAEVSSVAYSPDGQTLASGSEDNTVRVWEVATGQEVQRLTGHTKAVTSVAYSPDGKTLASGAWDNTVRVWEVVTGQVVQRLAGPIEWVNSVAYNPDGKTLASGSYEETVDRMVRVWEVTTGQEVQRLAGHTERVNSVAYSPDGKTLASGSFDRTVRVWEVATSQEVQRLTGHTKGVITVAYSPDGKTLASGSLDNTVYVWEVATGQKVKRLEGHTSIVIAITYSHDGKTLASGSDDNTVRVWEVATGQEVQRLTGHAKAVTSVAYSPDGQTLASGSWDKTVRVWEVATGQEVQRLTGHTDGVRSVAYSPDGQTLASGSDDNTVRVWDVATGLAVKRLTGHTEKVNSVAYSPNGKTLVSGSMDNTVRVWEVASGKLQWIFSGGQRGVWLSCQSSGKCWRYDDGRLLQTRQPDGTLSPILPPQEAGQLEVTLDRDTLTVPEGTPTELKVTLHNQGPGRVYWVDIVHEIVRDKNNQSPLLCYSPETTGILAPNKTVTIPVKVSALADYARPQGGTYPLNLLITQAYGKPIKKTVQVVTQTPSLKLRTAVVQREESFQQPMTLLVSLQNVGQQDLTEAVFSGKIGETALDEVTRKSVPAGEQFNMSFALPVTWKLSKGTHSLNFTAKTRGYPLHEWTFPNQSLTLPPPPWYLYSVLVALIAVLMGLIYYWRVFRHPLVLSVSQSPAHLYDIPLEELPQARRWLQRAGRWHTVLNHQQIPLTQWEDSIRFYQQTGAARAQLLANILGVKYIPLPGETLGLDELPVFDLQDFGDAFILPIQRCLLVLPPPTWLASQLIAKLRQIPPAQQTLVCVIISTDLAQQTQLQKAQQEEGQGAMMWVVPSNQELTRLLLVTPAQTRQTFAQLIAAQVKISRISPYQTGGGVRNATMFFGRDTLLADILTREPRNYLLMGARQLGKTSLLQELERRYQRHSQVQCFYLAIGRDDMFQRVAQQLGLPPNTDWPSLLARLANPPAGQRYVLLIDEVDDFIRTEAQRQYTTLHAFRNLSAEGRCHFILAGFWDLYQAVLDYHSPIKNFGESLRLGALEKEACYELATRPMTALNLRYADEEQMVNTLIEKTGQRANLIAILCQEMLQGLQQRRVIEETDLKTALDSSKIHDALGHWGTSLGDEKQEDNRLDRIIVYATLTQGQFSMTELWTLLNNLKFDYHPEAVKESLARLELAFILNREEEKYSYCVPLFVEMINRQGPAEMLKGELRWWKQRGEK
jgi:WD40 repeat protein